MLVEGSFKHYRRVAKLYGLPLNMDIINIEDWANECLMEEPEGACC